MSSNDEADDIAKHEDYYPKLMVFNSVCLSQKENPRNINGSEGDFCVEISAFQLINFIAYNFPILFLSIKRGYRFTATKHVNTAKYFL